MTRDETIELIKVMQAFVDGKAERDEAKQIATQTHIHWLNVSDDLTAAKARCAELETLLRECLKRVEEEINESFLPWDVDLKNKIYAALAKLDAGGGEG